jgi:hypothetical protein
MRLVVICDIKRVPVGYDLLGPKAATNATALFSDLKRQMRLQDHLAKTTPASCDASRNACSRSPSRCSSTPSPDAPNAHSPATTDDEPSSSL